MKKWLPFYYDSMRIDGYDKPINLIISAREDGKSTWFLYKKIYLPFLKDGYPSVLGVYNSVEIDESLIFKIEANINAFLESPITLEFKKGDFKSGICDLKLNGNIFIRLISFSIPIRRIKQSLIPNVRLFFFDEYIIDPTTQEKYPVGIDKKVMEFYSTYKRERADKTKPFKMYFAGNPYSLFHPLHLWLGADTNKMKIGDILVGNIWAIEWHKLKPELVEFLKKDNPLFILNEDYRSYALEGKPINDGNIKLGTLPNNYVLKFAFSIQNKFIGIYQNKYYLEHEDRYYCRFMSENEISKNRTIFCFEFDDIISHTQLLDREDKSRFNHLKISIRKGLIAFDSIDCYYLIKEIYYNI